MQTLHSCYLPNVLSGDLKMVVTSQIKQMLADFIYHHSMFVSSIPHPNETNVKNLGFIFGPKVMLQNITKVREKNLIPIS